MNPTLQKSELIHVIALTDRTRPSPAENWPLKQPARSRMRLLSDPSNECSKCPWSHVQRDVRAHVVHTLRCHFITTTKLSKNCQPTRFTNWRNSQSSVRLAPCQRLSRASRKIFFCIQRRRQFPAARRRRSGQQPLEASALYRPQHAQQPTRRVIVVDFRA